MEFDLVIHNGILVTVNAGFDIIPNGIVCVRNGTIAEVSERVGRRPLFRRPRKPSTPAAESSCPAWSTPIPTCP